MSGIGCIAAVVLNYKTWEDAVNCVNDLKAQDYPEKHIVVVENGSGNDSAEQLKKRFDNDPLVTVLVSETNLGFAKGNNLGIRYAHEKLGCDTVFVVNSDIRAPKTLFTVIAAADTAGIGAVSPSVNCPDGARQCFSVNSDDAEKLARRTVVNLIKANIAALPVVRKLYRSKSRTAEEIDTETPLKYVLYGCSYFLTPDFFKHYSRLYPKTFLYWEEVNLMLMLRRAGLGTLYIETEPLVHLGGSSTRAIANVNFERFRLKQSNRSMRRSLGLILGKNEKRINKVLLSERANRL